MNQKLNLSSPIPFAKENLAALLTFMPVSLKLSAKRQGDIRLQNQNEGLSISGLLVAIVLHGIVLFGFLSYPTQPSEPLIKEMPITVSLLTEVPEAPIVENQPQVQETPALKEVKPKTKPIQQLNKVINVPTPQPVVSDTPVASPVPAEVVNSASEPTDKSAITEAKAAPSAVNQAPKVSEDVVEPPKFGVAYLNNPKPNYPAISRRAGEEGRVLFRVLVNANGEPESVEVSTSSGFERLDSAALEAVKQWRFVPAKRNNQTISAYVTVPISFKLN